MLILIFIFIEKNHHFDIPPEKYNTMIRTLKDKDHVLNNYLKTLTVNIYKFEMNLSTMCSVFHDFQEETYQNSCLSISKGKNYSCRIYKYYKILFCFL